MWHWTVFAILAMLLKNQGTRGFTLPLPKWNWHFWRMGQVSTRSLPLKPRISDNISQVWAMLVLFYSMITLVRLFNYVPLDIWLCSKKASMLIKCPFTRLSPLQQRRWNGLWTKKFENWINMAAITIWNGHTKKQQFDFICIIYVNFTSTNFH